MGRRRLGWLALVLAALLMYLFENNVGTRICLTAAVGLPAVSALLLFLTPAPRLRWELPGTAGRNEEITCTLKADRGSRWLAHRLEGELEMVNLCTGGRKRLPLLCPPGETEAVFHITAAHCGMLTIAVREPRLLDGFGLFARKLPPAREGRCLITPTLEPVELAAEEDRRDGGRYSVQRAGSDPSETFQIREYAPGDPVRQIHWKLSEKVDRPLVRDLALPLGEGVRLILTPAAAGPDEVDEALDRLFSIGTALRDIELPAAVFWPAGEEGSSATLRDREDWDLFREELLSHRLEPVSLRTEGLSVR